MKVAAKDIKCIRTEIIKSVGTEAEVCLKKKLGDQFAGVPEIPDLDEAAFESQREGMYAAMNIVENNAIKRTFDNEIEIAKFQSPKCNFSR